MFQKNHVGSLKETVVLQFTNGYKITLEAGIEMSMSLTMVEQSAQHGVHPTGGTCAACGEGNVVFDGCCINCGTPATSG